MEDSDNMLFTSLLEMKIKLPSSVTSLGHIKTQELQSIIIQMLQFSGADVTSINQLNKAQKFRVATKLNQQLTKQFNTQFQLNDLMSSNINVVRKILVTLMSKMSMVQLDPKNNDRSFQAVEGGEAIQVSKKRQSIFDHWLKKQWVHPDLVERVSSKYNGFRLIYDMNGDDFGRKNILREMGNGEIFNSLQSILSETINRNILNVKRKEEAEGVIKLEIESFEEIKNNNKEDWKQLKSNSKKMAKARKKLIQTVKSQKKKQEVVPTIFQKQVEQLKTQTKQKQLQKADDETEASVENDDPLSKLRINIEEVKKNHEKQIALMYEELLEKQSQLNDTQKTRVKLEEQITKKEQLVTEIEENIQNTKVEAQKVKRMVDGMNAPNGLEQEIAKIKQQVAEIQQSAKQEISSLKKEVKDIEKQSKLKLNEIQDLKHNLSRIEEDYAKIIQQLAQNEKKKQKVHLPTQGISRSVYNKKIFQNQSKLKESKQQIQRMTQDISKLQERIGFSIASTHRIQTQIENLLTQDAKKAEDLQKQIKVIYTKYKEIYRRTIQAMKQINRIRQESRDYETRVREIANKNYKQTIQKLNSLMSS